MTDSSSSTGARLALVLAGAAVLLLLALIPTAGAASTHRCDVRKDGRKLGATYVTSLSVRGVSCARGKSVVRRFHACRRAHGGAKGRCRSRVAGFRCSERRRSIATQFTATVAC